MPSAALVVPSDITIAEEKYKVGRRSLGWIEWAGLMGIPPMLHLHYSKLDRADMRAVLTKRFDPEDKSPINDILMRRQESIRKRVVAHNGIWAGAYGMTGLVWWSFRRYNYHSRLISVPFIFYGGTFVGRWVGDIICNRNAEFGRDRFLGELPGKVYYVPPAED
eukprot:gnl/TRDRNA2_/TRDRNA2_179015_c0_seq1.p1 gnl/TRDRNA2_/TRDRNA2_179015_c0~~gnl/TRDRNA2_/TRDRNA2_179015_c0_seq1.p1  ORF type:complete len:164 (+),score=31.00 gnl/TRDRNA2_/TRDRNA2_179015_c0_seq1:57-548(+)